MKGLCEISAEFCPPRLPQKMRAFGSGSRPFGGNQRQSSRAAFLFYSEAIDSVILSS
ncbi:hypothetical protein HMPREF1141_0109 [Clostridium sp. MSTE9]|nr:hypothetical protein HMPREF1141_0109 [Clostridium sp. MSTE9]